MFFVVKNNAVEYLSNVEWRRLIWATLFKERLTDFAEIW